jgi:hypothetical protein
VTDPYDLALVFLGVLLVLIAAALVWRRGREKVPPAPRYAVKGEFFSWEELALAPLIEEALGGEYRILYKARLEDFLEPTAPSARKRLRAMEELKGRTVPFLLCRVGDLFPVAAIAPGEGGEELSAFPELSACGLPVLQFSTSPLPRPHHIRAEVDRVLKASGEEETAAEQEDWRIGSLAPPEEDWGWLEGISPAPVVKEVKKEERSVQEADAQLLCPECGREMTRRRMVRGPHAGRELWVCSNFPACRKTVPVLHD